MAQVPQHEWAQVRDDVRMLKDAFLTRRKPWGGGISNIGVHSEADWQQAEAYDAIQFMLRDNVETHQANVALSRVLNELSDLSARVSALTHALAAMSESQKNS